MARGGPSPLNRPHTTPGAVHTTVAVVAYLGISNLDEFQPLKNVSRSAPGLGAQRGRRVACGPATGSCCRPANAADWPGCAQG